MEELLLRMQAILRRTDENVKATVNENVYIIGNYTFDYNRQTLISRNKEQKLTSKEAGLLKLLCTHANDVLDRHTALKEIWSDDSYFNARSMDVYIVKLRKYLKDDPLVELLNVHGVGFKLVMNT
jgi:DNA-binding response OmpR family regulator